MDLIARPRLPLAFAACFLAAASAPAGAGGRQDRPSAADFQRAMGAYFAARARDEYPHLFDGHCAEARAVQCSPARQGRSTCTYRFGGGKRASAVLERTPGGSWRWVSGPYRCAVTVLGQ